MALTGNDGGIVQQIVGTGADGWVKVEMVPQQGRMWCRTVFYLPPMEYTPKPGDVLVMGQDDTETPFTYRTWWRINGGPKILFPKELRTHTLIAMTPHTSPNFR